MIVRELNEARRQGRQIKAENWNSTRLLLKDDGMGFSFHITVIYAGARTPMHYTRHLESVYCLRGEGAIEDSVTGQVHAIRPGVVYALDKHDRHVLHAHTELELACVFNPPLHGRETHDADGSYPLDAEAITGRDG